MHRYCALLSFLFFYIQAMSQPLGDIKTYLHSSAIPSFAKEYYTQRKVPMDDDPTSAIMDSIFTHNNDIRPFYILLVSAMLPVADGAPSEILGVICRRFVEERPGDLMRFFYGGKQADTFRLAWISGLCREFEIDCENRQLQCVDQSLKIALKHCNAVQQPRLKAFYKQLKQTVTENEIINLIAAIPEVQEEIRYVDSASHGTRHLSFYMAGTPTKEHNFYWIKVWEDNGVNFVTHFHFYVDAITHKIRYLDTSLDDAIDLERWRKKKSGKKI